MTRKKDIENLLAMAIRRERDAAEFYRDLEQRVASSAAKAVFAQLAQDELGHEQFLKTCTSNPTMLAKFEPGPDFHVTATTDLPPLTPDMKPVDAIVLAMKKEEQAVELYHGFAARTGDAKLKATFEGLAKMELGHKNRLETVFVNIGYPEVF
jgi:rubrerythrin